MNASRTILASESVQVSDLVKMHKRVRAAGLGHSYNDFVCSDDLMLSMIELKKVRLSCLLCHVRGDWSSAAHSTEEMTDCSEHIMPFQNRSCTLTRSVKQSLCKPA